MNKTLIAYLFKKVLTEAINQETELADLFTKDNNIFNDHLNYDFEYDGVLINITFRCGATRIVLIFSIHDDYAEYAPTYLYELENYVVKIDNGWEGFGYTAREVANYKVAKRAGFDEYFNEVFYGGTINGYPFYISKALDPNENEVLKYAYPEFARSYYNNDDAEVDNEIKDEFDYLTGYEQMIYFFMGAGESEQKTYKLSEFLEDHDMNDTHVGNMCLVNGKPIIFDYAGFCGETDYTKHAVRDYGSRYSRNLAKRYYKNVA